MNKLQQFPDYVYRFPDVQSCEQTLQVMSAHIFLKNDKELELDLIGLKPFVINALRQTIINDVPTMAIENVYFQKFVSLVFNCDYVAQRLSLIPIKADPEDFKFAKNIDIDKINSNSGFILSLNAKNVESKEPIKVYAEKLVWEPLGKRQLSLQKIEALYPKIPILTLKPNEEISCQVHCVKGSGRNHSKFCPAIASYAFHTQINIKEQIYDEELAKKIQASFPPGVIEVKQQIDGSWLPYVANERLDRHSRSFKNHDDVDKSVQVKYYRDHFIFTVESFGVLEPIRIVISALDIMIAKYGRWAEKIEKFKEM